MRGDEAQVETAHAAMVAAGLGPGEPQRLADYREAQAGSLGWVRILALFVALTALLLAAHGVHLTAVQVTRRRARELAVRRALGATNRRILTHVLGQRLRVGAWGVAGMLFWGTMLVAFMRKAAGMPPVGPGSYAAIGAALLLIALMASTLAALRPPRSSRPAWWSSPPGRNPSPHPGVRAALCAPSYLMPRSP